MGSVFEDRLEEMYQYLWTKPNYDTLKLLDQSLFPSCPEELFDDVGMKPLTCEDAVLDLGCGLGKYSFLLARRFGCSVTGIDMCDSNLSVAKKELAINGLGSLVRFQKANIEFLPFDEESFSVALGRDVLVHVDSLHNAFAESYRILKPNGIMLLYSTFATSRMADIDIEEVCPKLNLNSTNLGVEYFESCFLEAGFKIVCRNELGAQWIEYNEEKWRQASRYLIRLTRMQRAGDYFRERMGDENYNCTLANYKWHIYLMLGKLSSVAYQLQRK